MKLILKYKSFLKESMANNYPLGCVMVDFLFSNWDELLNSIDNDDVYISNVRPSGKQKRPHLTLLFGLKPEVTPEEVLKCFDGFQINDFKVEVKGVSIFENAEFDVVKLGIVKNDKLLEIHNKLSTLPNEDSFPNYIPHITLAYLKSGRGKKYINPDYSYQIKGIDKICYTSPNKPDFEINLK